MSPVEEQRSSTFSTPHLHLAVLARLSQPTSRQLIVGLVPYQPPQHPPPAMNLACRFGVNFVQVA
jgi:hypothetical protein